MKITKGTMFYMLSMLDEVRENIYEMKTAEGQNNQSCFYEGMFYMACTVFADYGTLIYDLNESRHRVIEFQKGENNI